MRLLALLALMLPVVASDYLDCIMGDQLIDSETWSVRSGDCVHGEPKDGHLHFQSSFSSINQTTVSWTSMRSGLHVPAGGKVIMDLKCTSFSFAPGNPEFLFADRTRAAGLVAYEAAALEYTAGRGNIMEAITATVVRQSQPLPLSCLTEHSAVSVWDSQGRLLEMHSNFVYDTESNGPYSDTNAFDKAGFKMETSLREQTIDLELIYEDSLERHFNLKTKYLLIVNGDQTAGLYDGFTQVATVQVSGYSQLRVTDIPYLATRKIVGGSCSIEVNMIASGNRQITYCNSEPSSQSSSAAGAMERNSRDLQSYCPTTQACGLTGRVVCWEYR